MGVVVDCVTKLCGYKGRDLVAQTEDEWYFIYNNKNVLCRGIICLIWMKKKVDLFLETMKVNKIGLKKDLFYKKLYFFAEGNKKLYIQIDNDNLDEIYKIIIDKYMLDRKLFLDNNKVNLYNISLNGEYSSYNIEHRGISRMEHSVWFNLLKGEDGKILSFEKSFISRFIIDRLTSIGKEARIITDSEFYNISICPKCCEYFICCGNVYISFSNEEEFKFLFNVVDKYNKGLKCNFKKKLKKVGK